jgi:hypothetical protein
MDAILAIVILTVLRLALPLVVLLAFGSLLERRTARMA